MSWAVKRSCTSQRPAQAMIFTAVWRADVAGQKLVEAAAPRGPAPHSAGRPHSTTCTALAEVQQMSVSAFTSAVVFT